MTQIGIDMTNYKTFQMTAPGAAAIKFNTVNGEIFGIGFDTPDTKEFVENAINLIKEVGKYVQSRDGLKVERVA